MELTNPDSMVARVAGWIQDITYLFYLHKMNVKMKWTLQNEANYEKWKMNNDNWK